MLFADRADAGRQLADRVAQRGYDRPVVLALPRGGVPVGAEVAARLDAPLDVLVVRKLGAPHNPEFGIGAVGEGGVVFVDARSAAAVGLSDGDVEVLAAREGAEVERRVARYRGERSAIDVSGRTVIVVDDGLATGVTAAAACEVLRARGARDVVLAVPVGAPESVERLGARYDEVVCLHTPDGFSAVGTWYEDFHQVSDDEVTALLRDASAP